MGASATPVRRRLERHAPIVVAAVLAVATVAVGLVKIGRSFNYDEAITYSSFINGGSLRRALTTQVVFNNHQMFSVTQTIAWRLGFVGETTQRLGPVLCGAVTVGMLTWATARRVGAIGGATAGTLLLLNPVYLTEFRTLRGYSLATMCVVLAALAARRSWRDHRHRWLVAQSALMVVAVTTHAYSALAVAVVAVVTVVLGHARLAHAATWAAAALTAFAIQFPLLDDAIEQSRARGNLFRSSFPLRAGRLLLGQSWWAVILTIALVGIGTWAVARRSKRHLWAVVAGFGVVAAVVVLVWLVLQPRDLYARFFISLLPFVAGLAGVGASRLPRPAGATAALVVALALVPSARDTLEVEPTIRRAAGVAEAGRQRGLELCGYQAEPLIVYTPPIRLVNGVDDFQDCELYVAVLPPGASARAAAAQRFEGRRDLGGGITVWGDPAVLDEIVQPP